MVARPEVVMRYARDAASRVGGLAPVQTTPAIYFIAITFARPALPGSGPTGWQCGQIESLDPILEPRFLGFK